jgi:acyl-CoA dehydrogenase
MMTLGGSLKRKERISARLADVLSELYLTSAVLKHFKDEGSREADLPLVNWVCENSLYRIQEAFRTLFRNLPYPPLGWILRTVIFPTGLPFTVPKDTEGHAAARLLLSPSEARDRLTAGIYMTRDSNDRRGILERALEQAEKVHNIEGNLKGAKRSGLISGSSYAELLDNAVTEGVIDELQRKELETMSVLRAKAIQVDAFTHYGKKQADNKRPGTDKHAVFV